MILVCGARPNFMKIAPIMRILSNRNTILPVLVHTGQHYDSLMSKSFFDDLCIPKPDVNLEVGSGSHAVQTANIMARFEKVLIDHTPDIVLVVGDVNSTIACGLVAVKLGIKLVHVEAGLRSFDRNMPEEINRILTDTISDILFVSERSGLDNLEREGIDSNKIFFVGNVMIDTLYANREKALLSDVIDRFGLTKKSYGVVTLHRPANVDNPAVMETIFEAFTSISKKMPLIFPVHPRTRKNLSRFADNNGIIFTSPLGYLDFLALMDGASFVVTDSGGIQEETTILGIPCMTIRDNTERPITVSEGTNRLVKCTVPDIITAFHESINNRGDHRVPELWDGHAAERIVTILEEMADILIVS